MKKKRKKDEAINHRMTIPVTEGMREKLLVITRKHNLDLNAMTRDFFNIVISKIEGDQQQRVG